MIAFLFAIYAAIIHESGHIVAAYFLGVPVKRVGINWVGLFTVRTLAPEMWKNVVITAAGPLTNVLAAACFYIDGSPRVAFANLFIGLFNLIPFPSSDGWRLIGYVSGKYQVPEPERNAGD